MIRPRRLRRDGGFTLLEVIVALGIFSVLLSIFVAGVMSLNRLALASRIDAQTSSQTGIAVQTIDKSIRYAEAVNYPGTTGVGAYIEWRTSAASAPSGVTTCTQLRYAPDKGTLAMRSWVAAAAPSTGTWRVILSNVRGTASSTYPFVMIPAGSVSNYQGLAISVLTGPNESAGTETSATIYAKNSSSESPSNTLGSGGQSASPVCSTMGYRP
ncbi:prepilin-type N-terminal cleavage/methylation domain-containing protein [uncultured Microbacterium sp.]|uniref:PulJ/GspJ family protein n=1 Tax=uncultured Microbacterium sp. TaxID=191216 RepID=UPI0028E4D226|nr:prepilin-type N-terminal cleavage/methylation domain-containing protein [uncultured Microbacterium sp.]